jgi:hypothetical protein
MVCSAMTVPARSARRILTASIEGLSESVEPQLQVEPGDGLRQWEP